jgi:hypothetical protein
VVVHLRNQESVRGRKPRNVSSRLMVRWWA